MPREYLTVGRGMDRIEYIELKNPGVGTIRWRFENKEEISKIIGSLEEVRDKKGEGVKLWIQRQI